MSTGPDPLDVAKFKLDAYKTSVELQLAVMHANAEFNFRMMQVAQLQVQVETDALRLRILQDAFADFQRSRYVALKRTKELQELAERYSNSINRLSYLVMGETAPPALIPLSWRGFWFLTSRSTVTTVVNLGKIKCTASERKGVFFIRPSEPSALIPNPPASIGSALQLMDWARKILALPKISSSPYARLTELLEILGAGGLEMLADAKASYKLADTELKRIREMTWSEIRVDTESPK